MNEASPAGPRVLVTGASGGVGAEVAARLLTAGCTVLALVHRNADLVLNDGTAVQAPPGKLLKFPGDVTRPGLGLPEEDSPGGTGGTGGISGLGTVDLVVHCAAVTTFGLEEQVYREVNVTGTANVVALARRAGVPLVHVSTAYVCGERGGLAREDELDVGQTFGNPYERSKFEAEQLVREAARDGLRVAVLRPSVVVGTEATGAIAAFTNMYPVLRLTTEGRVRTIPGHYDAAIDLVPVDYVADVVTEVVTRFGEAEGRTLHVVGGALTLRDFSDVLAEYPSFHVPRFVPPNGFDATDLPEPERSYYRRIVGLYESYFRRRVRFGAEGAAAFVRRRPPAGGQEQLRVLLDHCLRVGYLGDPLPGVAEVLSQLGGRSA